jgi:hypothetical protein
MPPLRTATRVPLPAARRQARQRYSPDMASRRRTAYLMLGGFVVSFGVLLYVLWQLILGAGAGRGIADAPTAPPTPIPIPPNAVRFGSLGDFERAPKGAPGSPFVITISEAELNARVSEAVAKQPDLPFRDVTVKVRDDRVDFDGRVRAAGLEIPSTVGLKPTAVSTRLGYELTAIELGPVPVPGIARSAISDTIDRELDKARLTDGFALDAIQARQGVVTLVGRFR